MEARRFVGRCLTNVSRRPSAKKLLLDPFLATEQLESLPSTPISTYQTHKLNSTLAVANEHTAKVDKTKRNTDMTITGTINEENNTIFLKVQIPDEMGVYNLISTNCLFKND